MNYSLTNGGHPNSLGNTIKVVEHVIVKKIELIHLLSVIQLNQIVRLRTSNAFKEFLDKTRMVFRF